MAALERIGIYPGTFDPLTAGHVSVVRRAALLFDVVVVAVARDNNKSPLFTLEERVTLAERSFAGDAKVKVLPFQGLLVEFARACGASAIIRGLRAVSDFEYEFQLALMNRKLEQSIQTVFLMSDFKWLYISSTLIRSVASLGGNVGNLVPRPVLDGLREKFGHPADWPQRNPYGEAALPPDLEAMLHGTGQEKNP